MPTSLRIRSRRPSRSGPTAGGFALIVVLTLMAFMTLLLLSLVTLIQVSLQSSETSVKQIQAQQNALLGLYLAVAQLQKYTGPDQRTTTPASFTSNAPLSGSVSSANLSTAIANNHLNGATVNAGTAYWTAAWGNSNAPNNFLDGAGDGNPTPVLLNWLVSGNDKFDLTAVVSPTDGHILVNEPPDGTEMPFTPAVGIGNVSNTSISALGSYTVGGANAVLLVGANTAGTTSTLNFVVAPLVDARYGNLVESGDATPAPATVTTGTGNLVPGSYAYWVGDEGVKAKYNIVDPYSGGPPGTGGDTDLTNTNTDTATGLDYSTGARVRATVPQRYGIEAINDPLVNIGNLSSYPVNDFRLNNIQDAATMAYAENDFQPFSGNSAASSVQQNLQNYFHDLTTYSFGVLADSQRGGLRYDLTTAFDQTAIYADGNAGAYKASLGLAGKDILPDGTNDNPSLVVSPTRKGGSGGGPYWDTVKSFYNLSTTASQVAGIAAQPSSTATGRMVHGITPVITQLRLRFAVYWNLAKEHYITTEMAVVLSNPYNIRINAPQSTGGAQGTGVDISFGITSPNAQAEPGFGIVSRPQQNPPWQDLFASGPHPRTWEVNTIKGLSSNTGTAMYSGTFGGFFPIVKNYPTSNSTWVNASNSSAPSVLDGVIFRIAAANFTFAPGESKIFFISGSGSFPGSPVFATTGYTNVATFPASGAIFTPDAAGAAEGSSKIINLAAGTAANGGYQAGYVFSQDTGVTTAVAPNSTWGHLVYFFPGQVMSMEMRTEGSAPGTNTLQRVINMDMTGSSNSEPGTNVSTSPNWTLNSPLASIPKGTSYRWDYATFNGTNAPLPQYLGGYYMMLALPDSTGLTFQVTGTGGNATIDLSDFSNYRTYADYNLRAANMAPEPFVPQNIPVVNQSSTNYDSGGFNTVPPYSRTFDLYQATTGADAYQGPTSTDDMDSNVSFPMHWGHTTATTGQTYAYLYTIPYSYSATDVGFLSIGQLQHCDLTADDYYNSVSYQPGNAVGNSFFNPYVERQVAFFAHPTTNLKSLNGGIALSASNPPGVASLPAQVKAYDISYLLNSVLWDKYFFSSLPEPNSAAAGDTSQPVNQRLKYVAGYTPTNADLGINTNNPVVAASPGSDVAMPAEYAAARYLMIDGPFNINSTSVNAWTALLWSMAASNVTVTGAGGNASIDAINGYSAFPRSMPTPSLSGNAAMWTNATIGTGLTSYTAYSGTTPESFTGFRNLNSATIANLAQQIVNQVRLRGPFVSLGQFINRTLAPYDDAGNGLTREGPLQAAIDQTIDTSIPGGKLLNSMPSAEQTVSYSPSQSAGGIKIYPDTDPNANVTGTDAGTFTEGQGARSTNIPGWLTQADLLEALGPLISARSDTFRVRAYGNVINPLDGTVQSQAWCEAIVQRYPDYVDPTDPPSANPEEGSGEPGSGVTASMVNIYFGRKYRIVSFHWLSPNQI